MIDWNKAIDPIYDVFAGIKWDGLAARIYGRPFSFEMGEWVDLAKVLASDDYFICLNRRATHLTTYLIGLAAWIKTGKVGYYRHAFMNAEGDLQPIPKGGMTSKWIQENFKFVEATSEGVHFSQFFDVFNCNGVCLLRLPKEVSKAIDDHLISKNIGKPYDNLFDLKKDNCLSCVEVVWRVLIDTGLDEDFPHLMKAVEKFGNLVPDMFYEAALQGDLEIAFEKRKTFKELRGKYRG
jgi:hypothetical protein